MTSDGLGKVPSEGETEMMKSLSLPSTGSQSGAGNRGSASRSAMRSAPREQEERALNSLREAGGTSVGLRVGAPQIDPEQGL